MKYNVLVKYMSLTEYVGVILAPVFGEESKGCPSSESSRNYRKQDNEGHNWDKMGESNGDSYCSGGNCMSSEGIYYSNIVIKGQG